MGAYSRTGKTVDTSTRNTMAWTGLGANQNHFKTQRSTFDQFNEVELNGVWLWSLPHCALTTDDFLRLASN